MGCHVRFLRIHQALACVECQHQLPSFARPHPCVLAPSYMASVIQYGAATHTIISRVNRGCSSL